MDIDSCRSRFWFLFAVFFSIMIVNFIYFQSIHRRQQFDINWMTVDHNRLVDDFNALQVKYAWIDSAMAANPDEWRWDGYRARIMAQDNRQALKLVERVLAEHGRVLEALAAPGP